MSNHATETRTLLGVALMFFGGTLLLIGAVLAAVALLAAVMGPTVSPAQVAAATLGALGLTVGTLGFVAFRRGRRIWGAIAS
jgi:hypothetical protein